MGYFQVRYDSRVVHYDHRSFIRLATDWVTFQTSWQRTLTVGVSITVQLVSRIGFGDKRNMFLFVCVETTASKPVKLETSQTVIPTFPYRVSPMVLETNL